MISASPVVVPLVESSAGVLGIEGFDVGLLGDSRPRNVLFKDDSVFGRSTICVNISYKQCIKKSFTKEDHNYGQSIQDTWKCIMYMYVRKSHQFIFKSSAVQEGLKKTYVIHCKQLSFYNILRRV